MEARIILKTPVLKSFDDVLDLCVARALTPPLMRHPNPPPIPTNVTELYTEWMKLIGLSLQLSKSRKKDIFTNNMFIKMTLGLCVNLLTVDQKLMMGGSWLRLASEFHGALNTESEWASIITYHVSRAFSAHSCNDMICLTLRNLLTSKQYNEKVIYIYMVILLTSICMYDENNGSPDQLLTAFDNIETSDDKCTYSLFLYMYRAFRVELTTDHYSFAREWAVLTGTALPSALFLDDLMMKLIVASRADYGNCCDGFKSFHQLMLGHKADPVWRYNFITGMIEHRYPLATHRVIWLACPLAFLSVRKDFFAHADMRLTREFEAWRISFFNYFSKAVSMRSQICMDDLDLCMDGLDPLHCLYRSILRIKCFIELCEETYPDKSVFTSSFQATFEQDAPRLWKKAAKGSLMADNGGNSQAPAPPVPKQRDPIPSIEDEEAKKHEIARRARAQDERERRRLAEEARYSSSVSFPSSSSRKVLAHTKTLPLDAVEVAKRDTDKADRLGRAHEHAQALRKREDDRIAECIRAMELIRLGDGIVRGE